MVRIPFCRQNRRPFYKWLSDPVVKAYLHHIFLMGSSYQFGEIQATTGGVRTGKSMTLCTEANLLAKHPLDEYNFAFTPKEYLKSLDNMDYIGEPLIWSELGTGMPARKWYSLSNILMGEIIQTMMIKKPIVLFDVPDLSFIDIQARKLIYHYTEAKRWETSPVKLWVYHISVNRKKGDLFFPHPIIFNDGKKMKFRSVNFETMPPEEVWIKYDERQKEYKEKLRKKNLAMIEKLEKEIIGREEKTIYDYINDIMKNPDEFKTNKGSWSPALIKQRLNIRGGLAKEIWDFLRAKKPVVM